MFPIINAATASETAGVAPPIRGHDDLIIPDRGRGIKMGAQGAKRRSYLYGWRRAVLLAMAGVIAAFPAASARAAVSWTGTGGTSWSTTTSWSPNGTGPSTTDTASFTDTGSTTFVGDITSIVNANRTIGGLAFNNTAGKYHTLDLGTHTLTVNGNLHFNDDQSASTTTTLRNGILAITGSTSFVNVGSASSGSGKSIVTWSGLTSMSATAIQDFNIGVSTSSSGTANGTLTLAPSNTISAAHVYVGSSTNAGDSTGTLHLRAINNLQVGELDLGKDNSTGIVDISAGGNLALGISTSRTLVQIGFETIDQNNDYTSKLDLTGGTFNGFLSTVIVGQKAGGGFGDAVGIFNAGIGGTVDIGAAGNSANFIIGQKLTGNSDSGAVGTVDFSGLSTLTASINQLIVGTAPVGTATGTLKLAASNTLSANTILVGSGGQGTNVVTLGRTANTITALSLTVGQNLANGSVVIAAGGSLSLGTSGQRTDVILGTGSVTDNDPYIGRLDLTGASLTAFLGNVTVGQRDGGGFGTSTGIFIGGNAGAINIGAAGNTANFNVGRKLTAVGTDSGAAGNVDFSGQTTLTASLNNFTIGTALTGWANGAVKLAATNTLSATSIIVGSGSTAYDDKPEAGVSTLALGRTSNDIQTPSLAIGQNYANGSVTAPAGASVTLGSSTQRTTLSIGVGNTSTNSDFTGTLDLSGATLTAYLGSVTVGQKDGGGFGGAVGIFVAGGSGTVDIGNPTPGNTANLYVSRKLTGGTDSSAVGNADFSGLTSLTASLNTLSVGTSLSGSSVGTLKLAGANTINALSIIVGSSGGGNNLLALGRTNNIQADQITIGLDAASASVTIPAGGALALGSATRRTAINISTGNPNGNGESGSLDLSSAALTAYLGNVVVGGRNVGASGSTVGTFTISNRADNAVDINTATLANGTGSTGTLNFGGGVLIANSIAAGAGTANFNWTGGRLSVGTFGTSTINFALKNTGTGTLSPGAVANSIATTTVFGAYTQASSATAAIDIAGITPGAGNDLLSISGAATFAGNLNLNLVGGFVPSVGQSFTIATYASRTGSFNYIAPPTLPAGVALQLDYTSPTQLVVRAVAPAPASFVSPLAATSFGTAANWDTGQSPGTTTFASITNSDPAGKTVTVSADTDVHALWLQSTAGTLTVNVPTGIRLAAANQIVIGPSSILHVDGSAADSGGVTVNSGGRFQANSTQSLRALTINDGGNAEITGTTLNILTAGALSISGPAGHLNLHINAMVVDYTGASPINDAGPTGIRAAILSAYHGGDWLGKGIGSNEIAASIGSSKRLAIGYVEASDLLGPTGGTWNLGQSATSTVDGTAILVRTTLAGDADLSGDVGLNDLLRLANHYGLPTTTGWYDGDFDYSGDVGLNDLLQLANNYGQAMPGSAIPSSSPQFAADMQLAFELAGQGVTSVPEPTCTGLIAIAAAALLRRNRAQGSPVA